jgi:hypothetical protein
MLSTTLRRASGQSLPPNVAAAAQQLLPPIQLYRRLLRAHRSLPEAERSFGDRAIKVRPTRLRPGACTDGIAQEEFRRHRKVENPLHLIQFLSQWKSYSDALSGVETGKAPGRPLGEMIEKVSLRLLAPMSMGAPCFRVVWARVLCWPTCDVRPNSANPFRLTAERRATRPALRAHAGDARSVETGRGDRRAAVKQYRWAFDREVMNTRPLRGEPSTSVSARASRDHPVHTRSRR